MLTDRIETGLADTIVIHQFFNSTICLLSPSDELLCGGIDLFYAL
jgi:hypothetical protein